MTIIPTPQEAAAYADEVASKPELAAVLTALIAKIELAKGGSTWVDQSSIPSALLKDLRSLLGRKGWVLRSGYNDEEKYSYYSLAPCECCHSE